MSALLSLTFGDPFTEIAALHNDWPQSNSVEHLEALIGRAQWAASYWEAANILHVNRDVTDFIAFAGPIMQNAGLACELTLKCLLSGGGHTDSDLKQLGHSLSKLYERAENFLDIYRFLDAVRNASQPMELPEDIADQFARSGHSRDEADIAWRVFSTHIHLLDESYDRPFRARYIAEGPIALPEPFIVLLGSLILLNAMRERLELPVVGTLLGETSGPSGLVSTS
ncbi:MAG: hypothetical protein AAGF28_10690 [Pseudomonadota bacterium]